MRKASEIAKIPLIVWRRARVRNKLEIQTTPFAWILVFFLFWRCSVHGVILFSTGDPEANITEPAGVLAGSGWQYQGFWGASLGTPIAPSWIDRLTFRVVEKPH